MDENRVSGVTGNMSGKVEEGFTGDTRTQAEGAAKHVAGAAQDLYGQARDAASDAASTARNTASSFGNMLRNAGETQPYTTAFVAFVALGLGWLIGRMHRPF
jgi:uncharacterized protein YjbJ (UPF0337 family)